MDIKSEKNAQGYTRHRLHLLINYDLTSRKS